MLTGNCAGHAGDTLLLFGGHTVEVDPTDKSEREIVHDDIWALDLATYQVRLVLGLNSFRGHGPHAPQSRLWNQSVTTPAWLVACLNSVSTAELDYTDCVSRA